MARKILLADDSVTAQNMGRRILSDAGYEVTTVNNGSAALKKIAESKPDLIVLDVYMPGYGGLEVCQRIRESRETARIPVLLTVGKLEPFKVEEARRVRADAFIVKPFEASELLTALTKLEDKIVPQPPPYKPGRFAKAMAAAEELAEGSQEFGDLEQGWKDRLKIPPPHHAKSHEAPPATEASTTAGLERERKPAPIEPFSERTIDSAVPRDITREEIAAIQAAAAAAFSIESSEPPAGAAAPDKAAPAAVEEPAGKPETVSADIADTPPEVATLASAAQTETAAEHLIAQGEPSTATDAASNDRVEAPKEFAVERTAASAEEIASVSSEATADEPHRLADEEVAAALASLAPAHGNGSKSFDAVPEALETNAVKADPAPVPIAVTVAGREFTGSRWIAEEVALAEDESALILEYEMQKAFAAFAAVDAARMGASSPTMQSAKPDVVEEKVAVSSDESTSTPTREASSADNSSVSVPERAVSEIPSISVEQAAAVSAIAPETMTAAADVVSTESAPAEVTAQTAYAAAAGSGGSESITTSEATSGAVAAPGTSESTPATPDAVGEEHESTLAAAWASWKQVRESVAAPELSSQVADVSTAGFKDIRPAEPTSTPEPEAEMPESTADEAVASIVDTVLAELKPKLMEEIRKKMGKDKKEK